MLSSISPVGETSRGQRWALTITAYVLASTAAGGALGALLGGLGRIAVSAAAVGRDATSTGATATPVVGRAGLAVLLVVLVAGLVADRRRTVPSLHRQVDRTWLTTYRGWVYGAGFGAQLGTGIVTVIPSSVVWAMWAAAAISAAPTTGALVGATFGLTRATPLVLAGRLRTVPRLRRALARMEELRGPATQVTVAGQAAIAVAVAGLLASGRM